MYEKAELIVTGDGSHTILLPDPGDTFHSRFGAIAESLHIYINNGFQYAGASRERLHILEIGFGTGLNALLTLLESDRSDKEVYYQCLEPYPLPPKLYEKLNYPYLLGVSRDTLTRLHSCPFNHRTGFGRFTFEKLNQPVENVILSTNFFDLVYFDAFGPSFQPGIWKLPVFRKISAAMSAVLVTYSASGQVRRDLGKAGLMCEKLAGPAGKREITRAEKRK